MLPGFKCHRCTAKMERVDAHSWMCVPCRINEYWVEDTPDEIIEQMLQREWDAAQLSINPDVA